jgi:ribosomal protein S18 acetylase RimI-like enzyme
MDLRLQPSQLELSYTLTMQHGASLVQAGPCYSAMLGINVVACAGVIEFWPGRSQAWALLSEGFHGHMKSIHRGVTDFLKSYRVDRLECVVDPRNEKTIRWAEHLGFAYESTMKKYTPSGDTQLMMVRMQ